MVETFNLTHYEIKLSSGEPENCVIFLHGYGADGRDLISIGRDWRSILPTTLFLSVDAPFVFENAPFGRQWFSFSDESPEALAQEVLKARPFIEAFINQVKQTYNFSAQKMALVGFSQGGMVALDYALHTSEAVRNVICYSSAYIHSPDPIISKPDILMIHGREDSILPIDLYHESKEKLEKLGIPVTGYIRAYLDHSIDAWGLETGSLFLKERFYKTSKHHLTQVNA